jgi:hypothetical protein
MSADRRRVSAWLAVVCGLTFLIPAPAAFGQAAGKDAKDEAATGPIPVKRIVMFSSGVAFYERNGEVQGDATIDLKFNTRDINDLLKSMVLQDEGGGRVSTVSYGSKDPVTRALRTFSIDLTSNPTLADLLSQVRGEKIEIDSPSLTGTILGIEKRNKPVGESQSVEVTYLNLLTDDGLRSVALDSVGRIKLSNPKLDADLRQALMVLAMGNTKDKKSVTLNFTGAGKRPVRVGYIQESPIWKTSYRLVLGEDKPLLQGWAIVENTTEEDWQNVNLTLISGRPISFVMDLYQPLYIDRPEVKPELYASLRPRTYDQDLAAADGDFKRSGVEFEQLKQLAEAKKAAPAEGLAMQRQRGAYGAAVFGDRNRGLLENRDMQMDKARIAESLQTAAQGGDVGELFQYKIATPVSVARQKSAMLPIVNESVSADKISIYNPSVHQKHPLNGLKLTNSTDLHLMQGPITVFDDGAYAGDAQIQDLPPKSERIISYAMDLDTEVAPTSSGDPEQLVTVKIVRGTLHATRKHGRKQSYVVKNSGKKAKNVLIEYGLDTNWTLVEPKEATEKTRDQYRFAVKAEPGKPVNLNIHEERTATQQIFVGNLDDGSIQYYLQAKVVSDKVKQGLADVVKRKQALSLLTAKRVELERQVQVIFDEQNRVRQNMAQLPKDSDLFRRYVTKFNEQEDKVEQLREQIKTALAEEQAGRQALDKFMLELDLS